MAKNNSDSFWEKLKSRNVIRAAIAYSITAWLLMQIADIILPTFGAPVWVLKVIIFMLLIGLPIALIMAWFFEMTPDGLKRSTIVSKQESVHGGKIIRNIIYLVLSLSIIYLLYDKFLISDGGDLSSKQEVVLNSIAEKSIAVLPFADLSPNGDQEYFSIGMMDEILNHLVKIKGLQVTSRTSAMQFMNTTETISDISKKLLAKNILVGSIRKDGDQVRITVQLIDGTTDKHLLSETYDKKLEDIFTIQSDVAQSIAGILQAKINPEVKRRMETIPTSNLEAYELWLKGRERGVFYSEETEKLYLEAIEIDPNFAAAYVSLGNIWLNRGGFSGSHKRDEIIPKVTFYLNKALELDNEYPLTHLNLSYLYLYYHWDFEAAEKEFEIYEKLNPSLLNASILDFYNAMGNYPKAKMISLKILEMNPSFPNGWNRVGLVYSLSGDYIKGDSLYKKALELFPDNWYLKSEATRAFSYSGNYNMVIKTVDEDLNSSSILRRLPRIQAHLAIAYFHTDKFELAENILNELKQDSEKSPAGSPSFHIAMIYAQMGETDFAFEWLEKAYEDREVEMYWLKVEPPFEPLRSDPRWQVMLDKVGFPK